MMNNISNKREDAALIPTYEIRNAPVRLPEFPNMVRGENRLSTNSMVENVRAVSMIQSQSVHTCSIEDSGGQGDGPQSKKIKTGPSLPLSEMGASKAPPQFEAVDVTKKVLLLNNLRIDHLSRLFSSKFFFHQITFIPDAGIGFPLFIYDIERESNGTSDSTREQVVLNDSFIFLGEDVGGWIKEGMALETSSANCIFFGNREDRGITAKIKNILRGTDSTFQSEPFVKDRVLDCRKKVHSAAQVGAWLEILGYMGFTMRNYKFTKDVLEGATLCYKGIIARVFFEEQMDLNSKRAMNEFFEICQQRVLQLAYRVNEAISLNSQAFERLNLQAFEKLNEDCVAMRSYILQKREFNEGKNSAPNFIAAAFEQPTWFLEDMTGLPKWYLDSLK